MSKNTEIDFDRLLECGNPRALALATLIEWQKTESLNLEHRGTLDDARDEGLYRLLVLDVVRNFRKLEWLIHQLHQGKKLEPWVRLTVMLGLVQMEWEGAKAHAAVNETVRLAELAGKGFLKAVINALLRNYQRQRTDLLAALAREPAEVRESYPGWLAKKWAKDFGAEAAQALLENGNLEPAVSLVSRPDWQEKLVPWLKEQGFEPAPQPLRVAKPMGLFQSKAYREGAFLVQDFSGQKLIAALAPYLKGRVLDACAAPGGKLFQMEWQGGEQLTELVGLEVEEARFRRLEQNQRRLRCKARLALGDARKPPVQGKFDLILADVPCSATGTIRKHPEIKWSRKPSDLIRNQTSQIAILEGLAPLVQAEGYLCYATCSLEMEENQAVVQAFLASHPEFALQPWIGEETTPEGYLFFWPGPLQMGGFAALLKRRV